MSHTIGVSDDGRYVILKVKGEITRGSAMAQNLEAHAFGRERGLSRFLVDVTEARNVDSITQNYKFAYEDMKEAENIDRHARVAALVSPGDHSHDFIETVARNSGLNVRLFTDPELAKLFLTED